MKQAKKTVKTKAPMHNVALVRLSRYRQEVEPYRFELGHVGSEITAKEVALPQMYAQITLGSGNFMAHMATDLLPSEVAAINRIERQIAERLSREVMGL